MPKLFNKDGTLTTHGKQLKHYESLQTVDTPFRWSNAFCEQEKLRRNNFQYWDLWTGARYAREFNPNANKNAVKGSVGRTNAVTGLMEPLNA